MSDNPKVAKECGATVLEDGCVIFHHSTQLNTYTSRILASQQAAHDAEIARLKEELREEREAYECTNKALNHVVADLSAANAACAMKDEALKDAFDFPSDFFDRDDSEIVQITVLGRHLKSVKAAIAESNQQVSEWERKQLEPLRAQVAMWTAIAKGLSFGTDWNSGTHAKIYRPKLLAALSNTQAAAEQFIAECEQRGAVKALEAARNTASLIRRRYGGTGAKYAEEMLTDLLVELRATSKKAG